MPKYQTKSLFEADDQPPEGPGRIIRVAFESAVDNEFDYFAPQDLWPIEIGQRVQVPFGKNNKKIIGFCVQNDVTAEKSFTASGKKITLKKVISKVDDKPLIDGPLMELAKWISSYYVCPFGQVLSAIVPAAVKTGAGLQSEKFIFLCDDYQNNLALVKGKKQKQIIEFLVSKQAIDAKSSLEVNSVLASAGCTIGPLNHLHQNLLIKKIEKTFLKDLPVIPEGLSFKAERIELNQDQKNALEHINLQLDSGSFSVTLLHGVTDSGKTEVYIRAIEKAMSMGKTSIVMLPEIALTAQTVQRFASRFERIAVMHSGLTAGQRNVQWQKIKSGEADVVIGARSAVFAPLKNLGLIVVDEEHEPSYKQDTVPRYHGRDVAIKRAQMAEGHCILASATPSLESLLNSQSKSYYKLVPLPKRVMDLPNPEMKLLDLKQYPGTSGGYNLISEPLERKINDVLSKGEQAIMLLNRRGYSNIVYCPSCKYTLHCRNCDVTLTYHKSKKESDQIKTITGRHVDYGYAMCHYCLSQTLVPKNCPVCTKNIIMIGIGSQRAEEELASKFPKAKVARIDSDSMSGKDYYRLLKEFGDGQIDILCGTQMLAKGLHFPNVTLVGIINADTCLYVPDFRSNERTFQLICQVAGRAGRSQKGGIVYVQTFLPKQPAIEFAMKNDYQGFTEEELKHRKSCNLPPYWRMAEILLSDESHEKLQKAAGVLRENIDFLIKKERLEISIRGPIEAPISRIQRQHRMQILATSPTSADIQRLFAILRKSSQIKPAVKAVIDIDPVNLL